MRTAELTQLSRVVAVAREVGEADRLEPPPPGLWGRVAGATEAGATEAGATVTGLQGNAAAGDAPQRVRSAGHPLPRMARPGAGTGPQEVRSAGESFPAPAAGPRRPWWRRPGLAAAGLVAAVAIAAGAWAGIRELTGAAPQGARGPQATVVARIALRPLPQFGPGGVHLQDRGRAVLVDRFREGSLKRFSPAAAPTALVKFATG